MPAATKALGVDEMHLGQGVGEVEAEPVPTRLVEPAGDDRAHHLAVDTLHDVERRAEHREVVAGRDDAGDAHGLVLQQGQHAVLAQHVVGRRAAAVRAAVGGARTTVRRRG